MVAVERSKTEIEARAKSAESALVLAESAVKSAVANVAMPTVRRLLSDCGLATRTYAELVSIIGLLAENGCLPPGVREWGVPPAIGPEVRAPWRAALEALRTDANAALPE